MPRANCWELTRCGREAGGSNARRLGVCPAGVDVASPGPNRGRGGGRICWAIAGTFCNGEAQGSFAAKRASCTNCEVFQRVQREEGRAFKLLMPNQTRHHALIEQFTSLMSIVESINAAVYVTDLETDELLFVNTTAEKIFAEGALGKPCHQARRTHLASACEACRQQRLVADGEPTAPLVRELFDAGEKRWFLCIARAIRWWDGRLVRMEICIDITGRKEAEQHRDRYLHVISHDLRNPLNTLVLRATVLQRSLAKKGLEAESGEVDNLLVHARQMSSLIADLLDSNQLEAGVLHLDRENLDLCEWVPRQIRSTLASEDRERVRLLAGPGPLTVLADPGRLNRVLENLLSNALKYSGHHPVQVGVRQDGGEAVVSVEDRGVGVPVEELPRLFQRSYRASNAAGVKGVGLGLYSARLVMEAHGGRIWAESEPGQGARFHFALPTLA